MLLVQIIIPVNEIHEEQYVFRKRSRSRLVHYATNILVISRGEWVILSVIGVASKG